MTIGNGIEGLSKREFSAKLLCCQASGGLTGHGGGQTGHALSGFACLVAGGLTGQGGGQTGHGAV